MKKILRYCFDLDGVICKTKGNDYKNIHHKISKNSANCHTDDVFRREVLKGYLHR